MILPGDTTPFTDEERSWINNAYDLIRDKLRGVSFDGMVLRKGRNYCDPFWVLEIDGMPWMATAPIDLYAHKCVLEDMHGHVCLTGLGIGVALLFAEANPKIESVTILENDERVKTAIWGMHIRKGNIHKSRLVFIDANNFDYSEFDCVFLDHTPNCQVEADVLARAKAQTKVFNWYDIAIGIEDEWRSRCQ